MKCAACSSTGPLRHFEVRVDGAPLRLQFDFCDAHGDAYLIRLGAFMGEFFRESGGSVPAAPALRGQVSAPFEIAAGGEPPLLNKSGGWELPASFPSSWAKCELATCPDGPRAHEHRQTGPRSFEGRYL